MNKSIFDEAEETLAKETEPKKTVNPLVPAPAPTVYGPPPRPKSNPITGADLRVKFQVYLHANPDDEDVKHVLPKVSGAWGGSLKGGGGWSGAIMRTLSIVAKMGLKEET